MPLGDLCAVPLTEHVSLALRSYACRTQRLAQLCTNYPHLGSLPSEAKGSDSLGFCWCTYPCSATAVEILSR